MQIQQLKLDHSQFPTTNQLSEEVFEYIPKCKKISKNKAQSISKGELKKILVSKFKKARTTKKQFKSILLSFQDNFQHLQLDQENFYCPICIQVLVEPIVTECGHALCQKCLENLLEYNPKCPVCRLDIQTCQIVVDRNLNNIIKKLKSNSFPNSIFQYQRMIQNFSWLQRRRSGFSILEEGQYIDIKCLQTKKWTQGCVAKIRYSQGKKTTQLYVSFTQNGKSTQQWININSSRLACHAFFTRKKCSKEIVQERNFFDNLQSLRLQQIEENENKEQRLQQKGAPQKNIIDQIFQGNQSQNTGYHHNVTDFQIEGLLSQTRHDFWAEIDCL